MLHKSGKIIFLSYTLLLLFLSVACSSTDNTSGNSNMTGPPRGSSPDKTLTPVIVVAKSVQGVAGSGPIIVTSPLPVPGGNANSELVMLKDRMLMINSSRKQDAVSTTSSLITLVLTVKNIGEKPIMNRPTFFQLMGIEGDIFTYQSSSSDDFYGTIPPQSARNGTIVFQIPEVAAHNLRLLYRSEISTETVLVSLKL